MFILFKFLSFFYSEEKVFFVKLQEIILESEEISFEKKYPFHDLERFQGISIPLLKIIKFKKNYCLTKKDQDLFIYENNNCILEKNYLLKIKNFNLKKIILENNFFILQGKKELKFFKPSKLFKISHEKYKKNKKNFSLTFFESNPEKCLILNEQCEIIKNDCFQCPFGSFEIYTPQCEHQRERICGQTLCGTYNNYACLRGYHHSPKISGCQEGSEEGFCQKDLKTHCINNTLICL